MPEPRMPTINAGRYRYVYAGARQRGARLTIRFVRTTPRDRALGWAIALFALVQAVRRR